MSSSCLNGADVQRLEEPESQAGRGRPYDAAHAAFTRAAPMRRGRAAARRARRRRAATSGGRTGPCGSPISAEPLLELRDRDRAALGPGGAHPAIERVARRSEARADRAGAVEVAGVGEPRVIGDRSVAGALVERERGRRHERLEAVLGVQLEPVALGRVGHDDAVAGQLLHAQQVLAPARVLDAADDVELRELVDELGRERAARVARVEEEHRQRHGRVEAPVPLAHQVVGKAGRVVRVHRDAELDAVLLGVLGERHCVGEDVVADLGHHRDAAAGALGDELVDAHALAERERPELPHHPAAEDAVDAQRFHVVLDRRREQVLLDVAAVIAERRGYRDPQTADALARQRLCRAEDGRAHAGAACCFDCSIVPPK